MSFCRQMQAFLSEPQGRQILASSQTGYLQLVGLQNDVESHCVSSRRFIISTSEVAETSMIMMAWSSNIVYLTMLFL